MSCDSLNKMCDKDDVHHVYKHFCIAGDGGELLGQEKSVGGVYCDLCVWDRDREEKTLYTSKLSSDWLDSSGFLRDLCHVF